MAWTDDFTVDYVNRRIYHDSGTTVYSALTQYSALQNLFDELTALDDPVPMSAQTPTAFTFINGWFMDDESIKFINGGAFSADDSWNADVNSDGIRVITMGATGYISPFKGDDSDTGELGLGITQATTSDTGTLLAVDNATRRWWVRVDATGDTFANTSALVSVDGATPGAGIADRSTTTGTTGATGGGIWANVFTLGTIETVPAAQIYIQQGVDGTIDGWWGRNHIDLLLKVKELAVELPIYGEQDAFIDVYARGYGDLYDGFGIDLTPGGRNAVPLATGADLNNTTPEAYVLHDTETGGALTVGEVCASPAKFTSSINAATYNIIAATNDGFSISVDGGAPQSIQLSAGGTQSSANIASDINAITGVTAAANGNRVDITSETEGFESSLIINSVANSSYATIGLHENPRQCRMGEITSTNTDTYAPTASTDDEMLIMVDGTLPQRITLTAGATQSAEDIVADLNAILSGATASVVGGNSVKIKSDTAPGDATGGNTERHGTIRIIPIATDAYAELGFQLGSAFGAEAEVVSYVDNGATGFVGLGGILGTIADRDVLTGQTSNNTVTVNGNLADVVLDYDNEAAGPFDDPDVDGTEVLTETGSAYTATLVALQDDGADGVLGVVDPTGLFTNNSTLTGGTSSATCLVDTTTNVVRLAISGLEFFSHADTPDKIEVWYTNAALIFDNQTANFVVGETASRPAHVTGTATATFNIIVDSNDTMAIRVDGGAVQEFVLTASGTASAAEIATDINGGTTGVTASSPSTSVVITSDTQGPDSSIEFVTPTEDDAHATIGFINGDIFEGAEGIVVEQTDSGATGTLTLANVRGTFINNDIITGSLSGDGDVNNTNGTDVDLETDQNFNTQSAFPYNIVIECGGRELALMYEWTKFLTRAGSQRDTYGYTQRRILEFARDGAWVDFVPDDLGDTLTGGSTGDTGKIIAYDNARRKVTVLMDAAGDLFDEAEAVSGAGTGDGVMVGASYRDPDPGEHYQFANDGYAPVKAAPYGTFAGGTFFGARGIWVQGMVAADAQNVQLVDANNVQRLPPDFQDISVISIVSGDRVAVFRSTGVGSTDVDKSQFNVDDTHMTTESVVRVTENIADDIPTSGVIRIVRRTAGGAIEGEDRVTYSSTTQASPDTFNLDSMLPNALDATDTAYVPFIDISTVLTVETVTVVYVSDIEVVARVRQYNGAGDSILPFEQTATFGSAGLTINATLTQDSIVT